MNILIVEDHIALREGVEMFLKNLDKNNNIYKASDGKEALSLINGNPNIELLITDLNMPEINGFELIENIKKRFPTIKIIVLTMYYNTNIIERLKELNINAFLTKNASLSELSIAIKSFNENKVYITPEIESLFNSELQITKNDTLLKDNFATTHSLSNRETEVLGLMVENLPNPEIASKMFVSIETIKSHRKNIYRKLGVNNLLDLYKLLQSSNYFKSK
jgi:DNA-binding NarL/FixJ family response regulator